MIRLTNSGICGDRSGTSFESLKLPEGLPLAMAYVPWQRLDKMYAPVEALRRGTLYPELDKPFMGCTVSGKGRGNG